MVDIEVDVIHAQALQAGIQQPLDLFVDRLSTAMPALLHSGGVQRGCHYHVLAARQLVQRSSKKLLAGSVLVAHGGIEKRYARIEGAGDNRLGIIVAQRPGMLARRRVSKPHAAQARYEILRCLLCQAWRIAWFLQQARDEQDADGASVMRRRGSREPLAAYPQA